MGINTVNFLKNIAGAIGRALKSNLANRVKTEGPKLFQGGGYIQRVISPWIKQLLVVRIESEKTRMVMRASVLVTVLTAMVIAYAVIGEPLPEAFHELLEILLTQ
jgi:hypothetical protein